MLSVAQCTADLPWMDPPFKHLNATASANDSHNTPLPVTGANVTYTRTHRFIKWNLGTPQENLSFENSSQLLSIPEVEYCSEHTCHCYIE